ncbi:hypothetical protein B0H14DRAFT_3535871 [Mycena olivaceomarginata]|nr:hypothetical protein B0H14DRAFT_3535871 [Mycena olivaceomarginata]
MAWFFAHKPTVKQLLNYWSSTRAHTTRTFIWDWAYQLQDEEGSQRGTFFLKFSLRGISASLRSLSPTAFGIFDAYSSTKRQVKTQSNGFLKRREVLSGSVAFALLNGRSQNNSFTQAVCGTYLMVTGAQWQHFSGTQFKSATPQSTTADTLSDIDGVEPGRHARKNKKKKREAKKAKKKRVRAPGTLWQLSQACRATARALASTGLFLVMENGTCATEVALHDAKLEDLLTADLDKGIANAPPLTVENLEFMEEEAEFFRQNMVHTILRIIIRYGGEDFSQFKEDLENAQPVSADKITVHQSFIHPLPAMEIDENSTKGNIEVMEAINKELGLDMNDPNYVKYVKILAGDQLTIARQRSILQVRLGHEQGAQSWKHIVLMPGLFHAKIADCHGVLQTHFGKPSAGFRSPGSLGFHNTVLDRLPITLTFPAPLPNMPRLDHGLVSTPRTAAGKTWWGHAEKIYDEFANADTVQELRELRPSYRRNRKGDMVFENAILFVRDALLTREFADAIKAGDSGRIVLILKLFTFTYRGNGRSKYAHEMLHVLHNIVNVWSDGLRRTILHNWLLCPTGKSNAFVEVDLVQEHLNLWIKRIYKADGDAHSWDWLAFTLGARQGNKHTIPDLANDIECLMASLTEHEIYVKKEGRVLDDDELPVPDVLPQTSMSNLISPAAGVSSSPYPTWTQYISEPPRPLGASAHAEDRALSTSAISHALETITIPGDGLTLDHDQLPDLVPSNPPDDVDDDEQPGGRRGSFCGVTDLDPFGFGGRRPRYGRRLDA